METTNNFDSILKFGKIRNRDCFYEGSDVVDKLQTESCIKLMLCAKQNRKSFSIMIHKPTKGSNNIVVV